MRKKVIAFTTAFAALTLAIVLTVFLINPAPAAQTASPKQEDMPVFSEQNSAPVQNGACDLFSLMFDKSGQPVSPEQLEVNIDKAIEDKYLATEDKAVLIDMYNFCVAGNSNAGFPCGNSGGCPFSR
jgi:uncharacterized protein YpmB